MFLFFSRNLWQCVVRERVNSGARTYLALPMVVRERVILVFFAFFVGLTVCRKKDANDDKTMLNSALERAPALCHAKLRQIACTSESTACKYLYYGTCMAHCARTMQILIPEAPILHFGRTSGKGGSGKCGLYRRAAKI